MMTMRKAPPLYAEFHARSAFSFLRGASQPKAMVAQAAHLGLQAIALTDHEGFYGSARAWQAAQEIGGIQVITGTTLTWDGGYLPVLCATPGGYQRLSRHLSDRHLQTILYDERFDRGDLIALTGDREGPVLRHLLRDDSAAALQAAQGLIQRFGRGNVYVELIRHRLRDDARLNRQLQHLAEHLKLPLLASNAPLHATRADRMLADAFTCLRHHTTLDEAGLLLAPNGERHLKSPGQMAELFADLPEALDNQRRLLDRLDFPLVDLGYRFPDFCDDEGKPMSMADQTALLKQRCREGARRRYESEPERWEQALRQIDREIELIADLGFSGYFLIVQDIVDFARSRKIFCQGRGSAANSVVCYVLGITAVDAVHYRLVFERFLSEKQQAFPDIDIDFPSGDRREEVIQYVFQKYGARGAAMTANVITYRSKSAFREMTKVLGFPPSVAERFSAEGSYSKDGGAWGDMAGEGRQALFEERMSSLLPPSHPRLPALERLFHDVLGLPRHLSQHSGGMVICASRLDSVVPIQPATMPGRTIVQWDKDDCEDLGIVKIDLLGLGMLSAMQDALTICEVRGRPVDFAKSELNDPEVFELLQRADTIGTFQVESRAQMASLPIVRPKDFYDIAIQVAIVRPGPIVGDLVNPYLRRRSGREEPDYIHPGFKPVLERTLGVPLFQEQVLRMVMMIAGFNGAEADELRRAMSFNKDPARLEKMSAKLEARMIERGVKADVRGKVIQSIGNFAEYGFPESHAISFAFLAYQSCWLKIHRTAEFYTGLINNQPMGFYSVNTLMQDAKRRGLETLPVCCLHSEVQTTVVDDHTLRLGLDRIKGLSQATAARIVTERQGSPFVSLEDLLARARPTVKERRLLARAGALNALPKVAHRRQAMWQVELPLYADLLESALRESGEVLPAMDLSERIAADLATQNASRIHPMSLWRRGAAVKDLLRACDLAGLPHGAAVQVGGLVICRQRPGTAKGNCFISLEDESGIANLFVAKKTFQRLRRVIVTEPYLLAEGILQLSVGGQPTVSVTEIRSLPEFKMAHAVESHDFH